MEDKVLIGWIADAPMKMPVFIMRENREGCVSSLLLKQALNKRTHAKTLRNISLREKGWVDPQKFNTLVLSSYYVPGTALGSKSTVVNRQKYLIYA